MCRENLGRGRFADTRMRVQRYRTIVVDPPWPYPDGFHVGTATGRSKNVQRDGEKAIPSRGIAKRLPYPSMSLAAIGDLPINDLADPDGARLFLWTTNRYLPHAFQILAGWGFDYRQTLVWHKPNPSPFSGSVAFSAAEYVLVGTNGTVGVLCKAGSSVLTIGVPKEHSAKPEAFLDLIEQISPGPRLELFARRQRLGWDTWGNEALNHIDLGASS